MSRLQKRFLALLLSLAFTSMALLTGCSTEKPEEAVKEPDFSNAGYICELSTLDVYYHNVAVASQDASGAFFGIGEIGYKRMWFEYSGVVSLGVDVSRVQISPPDENNVVTITMPEAEIMRVDVDERSLTDPIIETGWFTSFSTEEKAEALSLAQTNMLETANQDESLKFQARQRAMEMLEAYVQNVGELMGEDYTVKWVDA